MIRAVIDTNVLVSALISPYGNEALLLLALKQGLVSPCFSEAVLKEYSEVLARPKFAFSKSEIENLIALLRSHGDLLDVAPLPFPVSRPTRATTSSSPAPLRLAPIFW